MEISSDAPRRRRAGGELHPSLCTAAATPRREATVRVAASRRGRQEPSSGSAPVRKTIRASTPSSTRRILPNTQAFKESHGGHVCDELKALEAAISKDEATEEIGAKMYELLCTSLLDYDRDEADENKLVPSASKGEVIPKDAPGLVEVMTNLYVYGIRMIPSGFIEVDRCKEIVEERLAKRVGMTGEQLDDWLDVPDMGV